MEFNFNKIKDLFSSEKAWIDDQKDWMMNWAIKKGWIPEGPKEKAKDRAEQWLTEFKKTMEWAAILMDAKADKYEGKIKLNDDGTNFVYQDSKDIAWASGGGGGILGPTA